MTSLPQRKGLLRRGIARSPIVLPAVLILSLINLSLQGAGEADPRVEEEFHRVVALTQEIRGLEFKEPVRFERLSKPDLSILLKEELARHHTEEDWRLMQSSLSLLGAIPEALELKDFMYDLMSDQIAGLYDPHSKKMYVVGDLSLQVGLTQIVLEHELTHALTDQHFDLLSLPIEEINDDDSALAALAVVEGDATLSMVEYAKQLNVSDALTTLIVSLFMNQDVFEAAPPFFQASLIFPYLGGEVFLLQAMALYQIENDRLIPRDRGGWAGKLSMDWRLVDYFYKNPPQSTEQILHPEKIAIAPDDPVEVPIAAALAPYLSEGYTSRWENTMGEFSIKTLFMNSLSPLKATRAAEGWGGDRYALLESGSGDQVLLWLTVWDTEKDAREFREAFEQFGQGEHLGGKSVAVSTISGHPNGVTVRISAAGNPPEPASLNEDENP